MMNLQETGMMLNEIAGQLWPNLDLSFRVSPSQPNIMIACIDLNNFTANVVIEYIEVVRLHEDIGRIMFLLRSRVHHALILVKNQINVYLER